MRFIPMLLALSMAAMCGKEPDDSGADDSDSPPAFSPDQGHWTVAEGTLVSDGCGLFDEEDSADTSPPDESGFTLTMDSETSFTIVNDPDEQGLSQTTTCTLSGQDFDCATFVRAEFDYANQGYEAVVTMSQTVTGAFVDEVSLTADVSFDVTCAGADCDGVSAVSGIPFPCQAQIATTATHDM